MSVVRLGATKRYSDNWENIFSGKRSSSTQKSAAKAARKSPKKAAKKTSKAAGKKRPSAKKRKGK